MRTKLLFLTAAVAAITTVSAQVYSVNVVGYVNVTVPAGAFAIICNPLDQGAGNNTIAKLLPAPAEGTTIYKFDNATGTYGINTFEFGEWAAPTQTLDPGEGVFIKNAAATALTITFVGEVRQSPDASTPLATAIPVGFSMKASQVPQAGKLDADLGFPVAEGDTVYLFRNGQYQVYTYEFGEWTAPEPQVGEGFFVKKVAAATWNRIFRVQ